MSLQRGGCNKIVAWVGPLLFTIGERMHQMGGVTGSALVADDVGAVLRALANPNRLRLLEMLQTPRSYSELILPPTRDGGRGPRHISRQAAKRHLDALVAIGVVEKVAGSGSEPRFLVHPPRLFLLLERLRALACLRAEPPILHETLPHKPVVPPPPDGPHLVLVKGVAEPRVFPLEKGAAWTIGRSREADIVLDYDPCVDPLHARLDVWDHGLAITDLGGRNGLLVDGRSVKASSTVALPHGALVGVGLSLLLVRH